MIVTGASRGIGSATACLAAEQDYAICVNYLRNQEAAHRTVNAITQRGGRAIAVAADICNSPLSNGR